MHSVREVRLATLIVPQVLIVARGISSMAYVSLIDVFLHTSLCPMSSSRLPDPRTSGLGNLTATWGFGVRLANSLVRESRVCICKIFCIRKEGYHPL